MARYRLIEPHYLRVKGTKWEYSEVDRITGRPKRTQFDVPLYINPNYEEDLKAFGQPDERGEVIIVVSDGIDARGKDVIFTEKDGSPGRPTPGMIPLDEEAHVIYETCKTRWKDPGSEGGPSYADNLLDNFIQQMSNLQAAAVSAPSATGFEEMMATMTLMMKQQTELMAQLVKVQTDMPKRKVA